VTSEAGEGERHAHALALFNEYSGELVKHAMLLGCTYPEAEDVADEALLAFMERRPDADPIENDRAWLHGVTRNKAYGTIEDRRRHHSFDGNTSEDLHQRAWPTPEGSLEVKETLAFVRELPELYREAVVLAFLDLSMEDIAKVEDISIDAAKQRLSRGRAMLRRRTGRPTPSRQSATSEGRGPSDRSRKPA
jgi:RNA polymerase sigma factor (sigma-70 family)